MSEKFKKIEVIKNNFEKEKIENILKTIEPILENPVFLGEGKAARVITFGNGEYCMKEILNKDLEFSFNDPESELRIQLEIFDLDIRTPEPIISLESKEGKRFLIMETIKGSSIKDINEGRATLPENFDTAIFFEKLSQMVEKMNKNNFVHRDLHEGNIMLDDNNDPVIIDFGHATKVHGVENPYIETDYPKFGKSTVFKSDTERLKELKVTLNNLAA